MVVIITADDCHCFSDNVVLVDSFMDNDHTLAPPSLLENWIYHYPHFISSYSIRSAHESYVINDRAFHCYDHISPSALNTHIKKKNIIVVATSHNVLCAKLNRLGWSTMYL